MSAGISDNRLFRERRATRHRGDDLSLRAFIRDDDVNLDIFSPIPFSETKKVGDPPGADVRDQS